MKLLKPFVFGVIAASGALSLELIFSNLYFIFSGKDIQVNYFEKITFFLIAVVFLEEIFKYIAIYKLCSPDFEPRKKFLISIFAGLGFSFVELFLALFNISLNQNYLYFDLGILGVLFLHLATAMLIGHLLISTRSKSALSAVKIIFITGILHLAYNLLIIYDAPFAAAYIYLAFIFVIISAHGYKITAKNA